MSRIFAMLAVVIGLMPAVAGGIGAPEAAAADRLGRYSGLPLPRFAALKADRVNMRLGPGKTYAIQWELRRRHMPVRVIGEHGPWRRVELADRDRGWIHRALLTARRYAIASGESVSLYAEPADDARRLIRAGAATPLALLECGPLWCRADAGDQRGWAPKRGLWGVDNGEIFD